MIENRTVYICDVCSEEFEDDSDAVKQCLKCSKEVCENCQQEHALDECFC